MKTKEKKHRHKWSSFPCDCPYCETGEHIECECGEVKLNKNIYDKKSRRS